MDKALECGIRITKTLALLPAEKWDMLEPYLIDRCVAGIRSQRRVFLSVENGMQKSFEGFKVDKGVELYCRVKTAAPVTEEKGLECGIRIKQYILEMPDSAFEQYLSGAKSTLRLAVQQQRTALMSDAETKQFIDLAEIDKDIELYCEIKSMCS